ncbi:MAG: aromatic amino acid transport family protein [archaeon]
MKFDKRFWATAFTLSGTIVGAGILGLPYVFSKSGFLIGLFWLFVLGFVMLVVHLAMGEVALRTKDIRQIPGYAKKYIGEKGKHLMTFAMLFGIYSALIAYLIGGGESLSKIFTGDLSFSVYFALASWFILTLLLREGLSGLKKFELWGVTGIIILILGIFIWYFPQVELSNLKSFYPSNFLIPFGVVLFAMLGFTSVPELRQIVVKREKILKKAIIYGTLIPVALYILFSMIFVGVFGNNVPEVATLSLGSIVVVLGVFTMYTSYFVLSFALKDIFFFDYNLRNKNMSFIFVSLIPIIIYLIAVYIKMDSFVKFLGIGGVVSGGITGILILLMNFKAKRKGNRKPEYSIPMNWLIIAILSFVFILGIVAELFLG